MLLIRWFSRTWHLRGTYGTRTFCGVSWKGKERYLETSSQGQVTCARCRTYLQRGWRDDPPGEPARDAAQAAPGEQLSLFDQIGCEHPPAEARRLLHDC